MHRDRIAIVLAAGLVTAPAIALAAPTSSKSPSVTGKAVYGQTVRCDRGDFSADAVSFSYRWGDAFLTHARGPAWKIDTLDDGVACFVTATDAVGATTTTQSEFFTIEPATPRLALTGRPARPGFFKITGRITPVAAARDNSRRTLNLVVYNGIRQLTLGTHRPRRDGTFTLTAKDRPGTHNYEVAFITGDDVWSRVEKKVKATVRQPT